MRSSVPETIALALFKLSFHNIGSLSTTPS